MTDEGDVLAIMQQLADTYGCTPLQAGEFTARMFAEANGLTEGAAACAIQRGLDAGGIEYVTKRKIGSRRVKAYRRVVHREAGFTKR